LSSQAVAGLFGKVPGARDFVARRLPRAFRDPWDEWLQAGLRHCRSSLGDDWLEHYLTAPLWRFAGTADLFGGTAYVGVLMPSVDGVGRYFPLTIAAPVADPMAALLADGEQWFDKAERIALSGLDEGVDADSLDEFLLDLGPFPVPHSDSHDSAQGSACHCPLPDSGTLSDATSLVENWIARHCNCSYSLWRSTGSEAIGPCVLCSPGLPEPEKFVALLDGRWTAWGWCTARDGIDSYPAADRAQADDR